MKNRILAFIDVETTGGSTLYDRIIEVGILRVENGKMVKKFQSLVYPERTVPEFITNVTGISPQMLENSPIFGDIAKEVGELLEDAIFVAHNARFDYGFIRAEFKRLGINFSAKNLCTVKMSRVLYPKFKRHNLDSLINRHGFVCESRHRAYDDAQVLYEFVKMSVEKFGEECIENLITTITKQGSQPPQLAREIVDKLPETPGVYIFSAEDGEILYIGKSISIKNRVLSHFSSSMVSTTERKIFEQVTDVETHSTVGELGALLLESTLVKKLYPLYNRKLRKQKKLVGLQSFSLPNKYESAEVVHYTDMSEVKNNLLGIFRSERQVKDLLYKLVKDYELCPKLLGLEKSSGACFQYQLGHCRGACIGKEIFVAYNLRFNEAFRARRLKTWPYKGVIIFEDKDVTGENGEIFVVDNWRLIKAWRYAQSEKIEFIPSENYFDYETYKILVGFLLNPKNRKKIKTMSRAEYTQLVLETEEGSY